MRKPRFKNHIIHPYGVQLLESLHQTLVVLRMADLANMMEQVLTEHMTPSRPVGTTRTHHD